MVFQTSKHYTLVCAEAKYRAVAHFVAETAWILNLLLELQYPLPKATIAYCDNISAVYMSHNLVHSVPNMLRWIFILFVKRLLIFAFFMFPLRINMLTYSPKGYHFRSSHLFGPVSASVLLPLRLRGCIRNWIL